LLRHPRLRSISPSPHNSHSRAQELSWATGPLSPPQLLNTFVELWGQTPNSIRCLSPQFPQFHKPPEVAGDDFKKQHDDFCPAIWPNTSHKIPIRLLSCATRSAIMASTVV